MREITSEELKREIESGKNSLEFVKNSTEIPERLKGPYLKGQQDMIDYFQVQLDAIEGGDKVIEL